LAALLKQRFGIEAELIRGKSGVFDVHVDGKLVFSKHELGRFPEPGEVERAIAALRV
jgi:selenoprotein W-related protein